MAHGFQLSQFLTALNLIRHTLTPVHLGQIVAGVSTDSRSLQTGEVFLALTGERFDGHSFVPQALAKGAIAAIVTPQFLAHVQDPAPPLIVVQDTGEAYQAIAHWWRQRFAIPVIGITGSVGKTTTKEMIAAMLSTQGPVLKTQGNDNNEVGVPKTVLGLNEDHRYAVIEMAMRGPNQIAPLSRIARPDIGVITNVGTAHIGLLGSEAAIAQAKCELLAAMPKTSVAILNQDNPRLVATAAGVWQGKTITYGLEGGDIQGALISPDTLQVGQLRLPLPLPGRHNALNYLAALAVAKALSIDWATLPRPLPLELPSGRAQRHRLAGDILILDETYNAGLESMTAALELLAQTPGQRHIAILGTMKELGNRSLDLHHQVGMVVRRLQLDNLFILADPDEADAMAQGAQPIPTQCFSDSDTLTRHLQQRIQPGDRLLFKASRAVALDRIVDSLCSPQG